MNKLFSLILVVVALFMVSIAESTDSFISSSNRVEAATFSQVQAMHILVPTEKQALSIREEILTGKDPEAIFNNFMDAAKKYSTCPSGKSGGFLGWFGRGDMVPEFEQAAFTLPKGQVSEPVKTQFGWHLIYVISRK